jgi:hypothetical protein
MNIAKGARVRVTYEGEYVSLAPDGSGCHRVKVPCGALVGDHVPADATIEPVEDLQSGDVYRDADGRTCMYAPEIPNDGMPWVLIRKTDGAGKWVADCDVQRPLTLLVRDGKPVQP